jgi:CDP-diglyceride synthetase
MAVVAVVALVLWLRTHLTFETMIRFSVLPVLISVSVFLTYWLERLTAAKDRPRKIPGSETPGPPEPE